MPLKTFGEKSKNIFFPKTTVSKNYKFFAGDTIRSYILGKGEFPRLSLTRLINNIHGLTSVANFFIAMLFYIAGTPINRTRSTWISQM